jgi:hypothetical protein
MSIGTSSAAQEVCYRVEGGALQLSTSDCFFGAGTPTVISPSDIRVDSFYAVITPRSDPFSPAPNPPVACEFLNQTSAYINRDCNSNEQTRDGWCCPDLADLPNCHPENLVRAESSGFCVVPNIQPTVTLFLKTSSTSGEQTASSTVQTTVVTRAYRR